jgi:hypothetical protein
MPTSQLENLLSKFPYLSGKDLSAGLAGFVSRLSASEQGAEPKEWQETIGMLRGRLNAQLEALKLREQAPFNAPTNPAGSAHRTFYLQAIACLDSKIPSIA